MNDFAKVYGGALYALALEEQVEEKILDELTVICAAMRENPKYAHLIDCRAVTKEERLSMLDVAFIGRVHEYLLNFMKILCERNAFSQLPLCKDAFVKAYNEQHGIVPARVFSASQMTKEQIARLQEALSQKTGKHVELTITVDPALRGGLRVEMEGYRYDNTVASRMEHLRRALSAQS